MKKVINKPEIFFSTELCDDVLLLYIYLQGLKC